MRGIFIVNVLNLMSIVKYDIHRTYQLTSVGINQKKKEKKQQDERS